MTTPARGWFVTGTDTGVGKTRASVALLHALRARHARCVGMKPVAAGVAEGLGDGRGAKDGEDGEDGEDGGSAVSAENDDVVALRAASTFAVPAALDNPVRLPDAMSPHIAARRAGMRIDVDAIAMAYAALARRADAVVVEGAGGFLVPLSDTQDGGDLAVALGLPVLLVVGLRLGCLNHAVLTQQAIAARGLALAGWIVNRLDAAMPEQDANVAYLQARLRAPLLADWPWCPQADPRTLPFVRLPD